MLIFDEETEVDHEVSSSESNDDSEYNPTSPLKRRKLTSRVN